jgi:aspartyl-tRNA synthetase
MLYKDVIRRYGSDKPDMRFAMELCEVTSFFPPEAKEKLQIEGNVFALPLPAQPASLANSLMSLRKSEIARCSGAYFVKVARRIEILRLAIGSDNVKVQRLAGPKARRLVLPLRKKKQSRHRGCAYCGTIAFATG